MTGPKVRPGAGARRVGSTAPPGVTRDDLESFVWAATGWRGDAGVIDSILTRVDAHVALKVAQALATTALDELNARVVELSAELNAERAEKQGALDAVTELSRELTVLEENRPAPTVDYVTVTQILELLTVATTEAVSAVSTTNRTLNAVAAISAALRGADGIVKDIRLTPEDLPVTVVMEADAAPVEIVLEPQTIKLEIATEGDAQVAKVLGAHVISTEHIAQAEADRLMEQEATTEQEWAALTDTEVEQIQADMTSRSPSSPRAGSEPDTVTAEPEPEAEPVTLEPAEPDEDEDDPEMAAMIAEIEAEILAADKGAKCAKCGNVKVWENFYKDKQAANGHKGSCKSCEAKHVRERRQAQMAAAVSEVMATEVAGENL